MTIFFKHGPRFYRPTLPAWLLDCQIQLIRLQWGPRRMLDSCNGKLTAKILFDRNALLIGVSRRRQYEGRKVSYQVQFLNIILRVGIKKSWAQWDRKTEGN